MELERDIREAEVRKVEAERLKLELEAKEIDRRLRERWWESTRFPQYIIATVIASTTLFIWAKGYYEPIRRIDVEIAKEAAEAAKAKAELLDARNSLLAQESEKLGRERDKLKQDKSGLEKERNNLKQQTHYLEKERQKQTAVVAGLRVVADRFEQCRRDQEKCKLTLFSLFNSSDPINKLTTHGWGVVPDDRYSDLGYYLVITHQSIGAGKKIFVGRESDMDRLKQKMGRDWTKYVARVIEDSPLLTLDYSYLGLLSDERAAIGGALYRKGVPATDFYAPLSEWAKELGALLK